MSAASAASSSSSSSTAASSIVSQSSSSLSSSSGSTIASSAPGASCCPTMNMNMNMNSLGSDRVIASSSMGLFRDSNTASNTNSNRNRSNTAGNSNSSSTSSSSSSSKKNSNRTGSNSGAALTAILLRNSSTMKKRMHISGARTNHNKNSNNNNNYSQSKLRNGTCSSRSSKQNVYCLISAAVGMFCLAATSFTYENNNYKNSMNIIIGSISTTTTSTAAPHHHINQFRKLRDYMLENGVDEPIYVPAPAERYILENAHMLGYNTTGKQLAKGCNIWNNNNNMTHTNTIDPQVLQSLQQYRHELKYYEQAVQNFDLKNVLNITTDIRTLLQEKEVADYEVCQQLELVHPNHDAQQQQQSSSLSIQDLQSTFFPLSGQLSRTIKCGWIEPLLTPMRHANFCAVQKKGNYLNINYLVHDYATMCRRLTPTSKIVLFDFTSASDSNGPEQRFNTPLKLVKQFAKFGFQFDHIHAFQVETKNKKKTSNNNKNNKNNNFDSASRLLKVAADLGVAYHWMTHAGPDGGIHVDLGHAHNPWTFMQQEYNERDLIFVKMDIEGEPQLEMALAQQLVDTPALWKLVDQFYFEHHVHMAEMTGIWKLKDMEGSIMDSLVLFNKLRERGVPAHFWV